ncbi:MAG TPA: transposase [Pyrinomonadaceae bacterium]|nr:transposase [Pyrinomonadaceae bacterium]
MPKTDKNNWHERGYLPHFDDGESVQFITYRLADSMPQNVLERWRLEVETDEITDADFRRRIENYLDQSYGNCYLIREEIAEIVKENLLHFENRKYKLFAWVIMPNHVHLLIKPINNFEISEIIHSWKSFTANRANKLLERNDAFWFPEVFDRYIRNQKHFENTVGYIENNPVKARLCKEKSDWRFSSAYRTKL